MKTHHLKCWPQFFEPIYEGIKTFEIRRNDRDFQVDDLLILEEWQPDTPYPEGHYTGRTFYAGITYITDFDQKERFVVMAFKPLPHQLKP